GTWILEATHTEKAAWGGFKAIFPLGNRRYFGIRQAQPRGPKGLESIFWILEKNAEGTLREAGEANPGMDPNLFDAPGLSQSFRMIHTRDCLTLVEPHSGWMWVYALKDGSLKELVRLHPKIDEPRVEKNDFSTVVIGIQPMEDDTLLLVVRPESVALSDDYAKRMAVAQSAATAVTVDPGQPQPLLSPENRSMELMDWAWKHHPDLLWMSFDPAKGELKECIPPPAGAKHEIRSMMEYLTFRWLPTWDGKVEFRSLEQLIDEGKRAEAMEEEKKQQSKPKSATKKKSAPTPRSGIEKNRE
ncbi:MAG: hypothetical protein LWX11_03160, partial [Firmicutes bacterium]|nr:hypothetical protein [Bacillota bacterium]